MNKPWLLIVGSNFYPQSGTKDWVKRFDTEESASDYLIDVLSSIGWDWYEIVNLETWGMDKG